MKSAVTTLLSEIADNNVY